MACSLNELSGNRQLVTGNCCRYNHRMSSTEPIIFDSRVEPFMKNGYLVASSEGDEAVYIDPGDEAPKLLDWARKHKMRITGIANTHGHLDHISGVRAVKEAFDAPIYLHPADEELYNQLSQQAAWFGLSYPPAPPVDRFYNDGDLLQVGNLIFHVHHTPGHSPGGVCLELGEHVFCGDLVFLDSIGRTDLPGGSYDTLMSSIREKLLPLGDEKILHCGHGPDTTIGRERRENPFLKGI
ncbi:MAG: MBL fold metallo-hydrolase [Acidobacteria bacterium]|nr:MAG: MBL fold metallo-hydrolase [Acidobacteriota bacterium]